MELILGIDQGTTGSTLVLYDQALRCVAKSTREFPQHFPKPGWVEHDLKDIQKSIVDAYKDITTQVGKPFHIVGIGITNQRETVALWDENGKPLGNAIVWQDRRTADLCQKLKKYEKVLKNKTGLVLDAYFSATKMQWMLKNYTLPSQVYFGTIDSFILYWLTGVHATDASNASRTLLYNIEKGNYDPELQKIFKINKGRLPEVRNSFGKFGVTKNSFLPDGIPVMCILGDQQSALFGQQAWNKGQSKATYGTGSFVLVNTGSKKLNSKNKLLTTIAWQKNGKVTYALEGSAFVCGSLVQWLRDGLGIIKSASEVEGLASSVKDVGGVSIIPALTGMGAPYWNSSARGAIFGITRGTTRAHIARAALWAMAIQNAKLLQTFVKDGAPIKELRVDGGAVVNNLLMQMQADACGIKVVRPSNIETTSLGAVLGAGLEASFYDEKQIQNSLGVDQEFKATTSSKERKKFIEQFDLGVSHS